MASIYARSSIYQLDPKALTDRVREKVKLVDLMVSDKIPGIRPSDTEQQISCPFHGQDSSPSMRVYPHTNSCYCWTCKESWDPVSYTMRRRGLRFIEALAALVSAYSVPLDGVPNKIDKVKTSLATGGNYKERMEAASKQAKTLSRDGVISRLEGHMKALRGKVPSETYGKLVYLLSRAKFTDEEKEYRDMATLVSSSVRKVMERA